MPYRGSRKLGLRYLGVYIGYPNFVGNYHLTGLGFYTVPGYVGLYGGIKIL